MKKGDKPTVPASIFVSFYKQLRRKFFEEFVKPNLKEDSEATEEEERIWNVLGEDKKTPITKSLFDVKNPQYFYKKYEEGAKFHIEYDYPLYPVTVDRKNFTLALKYLLFGNVTKIADFPELDFDLHAKWEKNYSTLLNVFMKNEFPNGVEEIKEGIIEKKLSDDKLDNTFLDTLTSWKGINIQPLEKVINTFFNAISSRNYIDAWHLVSPRFQSHSIWAGSLQNFENSFSIVDSITNIKKIPIYYKHRKVKCGISYREKGYIIDYSDISDKEKLWFGRVLENYLRDINYKISCVYSIVNNCFNWNGNSWNETEPFDFLNIDKKHLYNNSFQKVANMVIQEYSMFLNAIIAPCNSISYDNTGFALITLRFEYGRWLISEIEVLADDDQFMERCTEFS
ncbi:hypothetical protein [Chitinophaga pinensis]|uniref:hypothetical protein n=1 Tax=Chitinophaga pinensis TaxID=79329 RepID=UPI00030731F4|nr:hypothetical protein [Chitinophaga pinensis]